MTAGRELYTKPDCERQGKMTGSISEFCFRKKIIYLTSAWCRGVPREELTLDSSFYVTQRRSVDWQFINTTATQKLAVSDLPCRRILWTLRSSTTSKREPSVSFERLMTKNNIISANRYATFGKNWSEVTFLIHMQCNWLNWVSFCAKMFFNLEF